MVHKLVGRCLIKVENGRMAAGFGDKFDDDWTMHMFLGHKYTSGRLDKEGCLATEILIKNY